MKDEALHSDTARRRVAVTTLGCRLNQAESDAIEAQLRARGWQVGPHAEADVHIINTCTITHQADADTRQRVAQLHRAHPDAEIVVTGCHATAAPEEIVALPGVTQVITNWDKHDLPQRLGASAQAPTVIPLSMLRQRARVQATVVSPALQPQRSRSYLKIQDGCDYQCAFCIVPHVRGRSRSVPPETLVEQTRALVATGVPEIIITGVHLGIYGRDLQPRLRLEDLLARLLPELGQTRLRLGSLDPHEVSDTLLDLYATNPQHLSPSFHLAIQSADDRILRRMHRAHKARDLDVLLPRIADKVPDAALGLDVIVGFPGEDDAAFERTYETLAHMPLSSMHVFRYSKRSGTAAATMSDQVPEPTKQARSRRLRRLAAQKKRLFEEQQVGRSRDAIVLRPRAGRPPVALTDNYVRVILPHGAAPRAGWQRVHINALDAEGCVGTLLAPSNG